PYRKPEGRMARVPGCRELLHLAGGASRHRCRCGLCPLRRASASRGRSVRGEACHYRGRPPGPVGTWPRGAQDKAFGNRRRGGNSFRLPRGERAHHSLWLRVGRLLRNMDPWSNEEGEGIASFAGRNWTACPHYVKHG